MTAADHSSDIAAARIRVLDDAIRARQARFVAALNAGDLITAEFWQTQRDAVLEERHTVSSNADLAAVIKQQ